MGVNSNSPIIIKRKKVVAGDGHHGGAWKVAYADFVTAMMAFFMLMWLLNATTEKQRKGIADYFSPTIPINRISGGGDGSFGGDSVFSDETLVQNGTGGITVNAGLSDIGMNGQGSQSQAAFDQIEASLFGSGGESFVSDKMLQHIVTRVTDEGLVIELFDLEDMPLFKADQSEPTPLMDEIALVFADVFSIVDNDLALGGHTRTTPVVRVKNPVWELSQARADRVRQLLVEAGFPEGRVARVTGHADRELSQDNPMDVRNNRIELVLLRSD